MGILDKAQEHYQEVLKRDPNPIEIPEWGGTYYVRPQISVKNKMEIQAKLTGNQMDEGLALTLIYYLLDGSGEPCFKKADRVTLMRSVDPDVMIRVAGEIADMQPKAEDIAGN
jgi:hypothetical protein